MRAQTEIPKQAALEKASRRWAGVFLFAICSLAATVMLAQDHHADPAHSWPYFGERGPEHWGDLSPEFAACGAGQAQPPLDITHPNVAQLPPIHFAYSPSPPNIIDNVHIIQLYYARGNTIALDGKPYQSV